MEPTPKKSQCDRLLDELKTGRELSSLDILNDLRILNYKGRIADLRAKLGPGFITTEMKKPKGGNQEIAHYKLINQGQLNLKN